MNKCDGCGEQDDLMPSGLCFECETKRVEATRDEFVDAMRQGVESNDLRKVIFCITDKELAQHEPRDVDISAKWCSRCRRMHSAHNPKEDHDAMIAASVKSISDEVDLRLIEGWMKHHG